MLYKLRNSLRYRYFEFRTRDILTSAPLACDPDASCELHTMLSAGDYQMYLVAVKSLLRFCRSLAVVIHSDGSLTPEHEAGLRRHVPGCTIISPAAAAERAARELPADSLLARWRRHDPVYRRMIDSELWTRTHKRVMMDSDIIVTREPKRLLEWIRTPDAPGFLLGDPTGHSPTLPDVPVAPGEHIQNAFRRKLPALSRAVGLPVAFLQNTTAGFYGCTHEVALGPVERVLDACVSLGLPMEQWGAEQCIVMYLISATGGAPLDARTCINFAPGDRPRIDSAEIVHFYGTYRFFKHLYTRLAVQTIESLSAAPAGA